ncbi:unnamed protein product [Vitrella brassicaformis CCMP3155]|uniref:J domain-containing protein n=1 Tax=Vitrella brassicaformis (strain CCMP3155) TaxID=1169540 RepID=A0A0G4ELS2_VITBC|nr:unnamed protein product [Vitrella brassicaformis CCMP3155]|eukprot:CEL97969.1 unnamed protein product [Vitrella brassicaformis CCMP3155]
MSEAVVERVLSARSAYEVLELQPQWITDTDVVRKAYKRISLLVHPDKCTHPKASDAFRVVFGALQVLSDASEQERALHAATGHGRGGASNSFDSYLHQKGGSSSFVRWWEKATIEEMEQAFAAEEEKFRQEVRAWEARREGQRDAQRRRKERKDDAVQRRHDALRQHKEENQDAFDERVSSWRAFQQKKEMAKSRRETETLRYKQQGGRAFIGQPAAASSDDAPPPAVSLSFHPPPSLPEPSHPAQQQQAADDAPPSSRPLGSFTWTDSCRKSAWRREGAGGLHPVYGKVSGFGEDNAIVLDHESSQPLPLHPRLLGQKRKAAHVDLTQLDDDDNGDGDRSGEAGGPPPPPVMSSGGRFAFFTAEAPQQDARRPSDRPEREATGARGRDHDEEREEEDGGGEESGSEMALESDIDESEMLGEWRGKSRVDRARLMASRFRAADSGGDGGHDERGKREQVVLGLEDVRR